eukprot:GDKJ01019173.1.p1 GENE.GDKJ01019173.1~~GDKJ01019173.1.p1  ORF type:complete len:233 (+),score=-18.41 GDKJ01019173.1:87-785(+)
MNRNRTYLTLLLMLFVMTKSHESIAQLFASYREFPKPTVIFVRLPTYTKRAAIYENAQNYSAAKQIKEDAVNMQRELIKDFNANFKFCDYYFYYDTVQESILEKKFVGNLYDKNMKPITASPLQPDDDTYQIAYFGYYITEFGKPDNPHKGKEDTYYPGSQLQRLILVDHKFERIPDPVPNGTNYDDRYMGFRARIRLAHTYKSKKFDIYYTPYAKILSLHLNNYYNRQNVK